MATPQPNEDREIWQRWKSEIDFASKDKNYVEWLQKSEKIVKRYRDERNDAEKLKRRMNILWSNVETLRPAVYSKMPKPIVERRFMDRDPAARLASTILERCLSVQMEAGYYHKAVGRSVLDYLLTAMGQVWLRYEPQFEAAEVQAENKQIDGQERTAEEIAEDGDGAPYEKLAYERVCVDYIDYRDFLWGPARTWQEVPWVSRRTWLTRSEIAEKFFGGDLEKAKVVTLDYTPDSMKDKLQGTSEGSQAFFKKAEIREIWNKADNTVYFIAPGTPDLVLKKEKNPVLQLEGFWPCPMPLFATQTNDTLIPVPDYVEYQDQAMELDDLTGRIAALTTALRANGVYDASFPALARLLSDGQDNKLVPVDQWAAFAEKGGMAGAISLVPIKEIAEVLIGLYNARQQVKGDLYEVTGMSDIVRGQGDKGETATAQRIKGQFASMRLEDRRDEVARFCRDTLRIMAEIISEMFSEEVLLEMSGVGLMIQDDVRAAVEDVPEPPPPPQQGENGQPLPPEIAQQMQMQGMQAYEQAKQQAQQAAMQKGMQEFQQALQILRSDKLRGFRVDIETDTTIAADAEADKQSAVELVKSTIESLVAAGPVIASAPELAEPIGGMLMFAFRRFRVGRTLEAKLEDALDQIQSRVDKMKDQPPPPSPEEIKAKAEADKQAAETQRDQQKHQFEMQAKAADFKMEQERNAMEMARMREELEIERERLQFEREKVELQRQSVTLKAAVDVQKVQMQSAAAQEQHAMEREAADHTHQLGMQTMEAKAQAAQQQAKAKPKEKA